MARYQVKPKSPSRVRETAEALGDSPRSEPLGFKVTVADLSHTEMSEGNVMAYAVLMLSRGGEIKIDVPHSTRRIIGRQASIDGVDGSQTYASVFFHNRRLYQIEGTVPAGGSTADAIRFQQSFDFTDGWRLPDALSNELRAR